MNAKHVGLAVAGIFLLVVIAVAASGRQGMPEQAPVSTGTQSEADIDTQQLPSAGVPVQAQPETGTAKVEARLGQGVSALGMTVTPLEVVEESRCPQDVQCIQAGTVRVRVRLSSGLGTSGQVIALGGSMTTEAETVKLVDVTPYPSSGTQIAPESYRFTFEIARR